MKSKKSRFKKVLLINTPGIEQDGYRPSPLGILYLASYLREFNKNIQVQIIDGAFEGEKATVDKIKAFQPDLIGLSALTPSRINAIKLIRTSKKISPKCQVVIGGVHPTLMWEQMLRNYPKIDFIIKGEGEITLLELTNGTPLKKIKGLAWRLGNRIVNNPDRPMIKNLDKIPFPAWDMIDPMKYPPLGKGNFNGIDLEKEVRVPLIFSRGCMGSCTFCSSWRIWKGYRYRSGKNVADEIELLYNKYGARHFNFQDDTLTGNRNEIISFCNEVIKRNLKLAIFGCTRVDCVDEELLNLMREAGFYEISFGIESGSLAMLTKINKKTDLVKIRTAIELTKKAGIKACALMMYGLPGETKDDKNQTETMLTEIRLDEIATLGEVWIFPGTVLYNQAKKAGLLTDKFWLSKKPYYIYRGGIGNDPYKRYLILKDRYNFYIKPTILGKIFTEPILKLRRNYYIRKSGL